MPGRLGHLRIVADELGIKSEGTEDTFKGIAFYSKLAMVLFRKEETKKGGCVSSFYDNFKAHPMIAMREEAEKQQEDERRREVNSLIDKRIKTNNN